MRVLKHSPIALAALLALGASESFAQPAPTTLPVQRTGGAAINATVGTPANNALTVTQRTSATNRALVEWQSFSIGNQARVNIVQPNAQSVLVNRVVGDGKTAISVSEIYGSLSANGRVFLVNPSGVVFGPGAQVNVGALVATSLDLDPAMVANNYAGLVDGKEVLLAQTVGASQIASIQVLGAIDPAKPQIQVTEGGSIVLVSRDLVAQNGSIAAPGGHINISSGQAAVLQPVGSSGFVELLSMQPSESRSGGINFGFGSQTLARGGSIVAGAQPGEQKTIRSDSITVSGLVSADSPTGAAGSVRIDAGTEGTLTATEGAVITASGAAGTGGQVTLQGRSITLQRGDVAHPRVLAEGATGGGQVEIGDGSTRALAVERGTTVSADATEAGSGGSIRLRALYSNTFSTAPVARVDFGVTEVYGTLSSRGGIKGGNGGSIETSGTALTTSLTDPVSGIAQAGTIDARARAAGGLAGAWTLDPFDVTISNAGATAINGAFNPTGPGANVRAADLSAALDAGTSIDISTAAGGAGTDAGNITLATGTTISRSTTGAAVDFTLRANNSIVSNAAVIDASQGGAVNVNFFSDLDGNGGGIILQGGSINTGGGNLTLAGGADPSTGFAIGGPQNPGIAVARTGIDTRSNQGGATGNVTMRGQAATGSFSPGVSLDADLFVNNLSVKGQANHGTGVLLNGSSISTVAGNIDVRGVSVRPDTATANAIGVDTGTLRVQLGNGSLTLAGRGEDAGGAGGAVGLRLGDLQISASTASTGTITLAGQSAGNTIAPGVQAISGNSGLVIRADAQTPGSPATGANVVIGGLATVVPTSLDLVSGIVPTIVTTGAVNIRPLGVDANGVITEQAAVPIRLQTPQTGVGSLIVNSALLQAPSANNGGISAVQGVVIGSQAHTGAIDVATGALTNHATLALTLQNEGAGSQGITLGGGNSVGSLGLLSAGNVSQTGALNVQQGLVIRGGAQSNVNLSFYDDEIQLGNQFGRVAFDPPASLSIVTPGNLVIDAASATGYNTATGNFAPVAITGSQGGTVALLQSVSGNVLVNQSITMTDPGASLLQIVSPNQVIFANGTPLATSATGRWRVWANSVVNLPGAGTQRSLYGCQFGDTATCSLSGVAIPTAGNQLLVPTRPTVTVTPNNATGTANAPLPPLTFIATGLVNGDTAATAFSGALGTSATPSSPAGTYSITAGTLASPTGYIVAFAPGGNLTLGGSRNITREMLQSRFSSEIRSDVYGNNLDQPYICTAASVIRGSLADDKQSDPLASEWGKVRNQPQLSGCLNVTDGGSCSAF